jgi:hypothetical protein
MITARLLAVVLALLAVATAANAADSPVATATLVVGDAWRVSSQGTLQPLRAGDALHEGDRIRTGVDGLVQVAFVDAARLSLRADSEVVLTEYRTVEGDSAMRLELERGVVRQISGEAAKRAPQSYRLNTPIAAIGVRGTDFLVRADAERTQTFVQEGAIVLAAIGPGCAAGALGACDGGQLISRGEGIWEVTREGELLSNPVEPERLEQIFGSDWQSGVTGTADQAGSQAAPSAIANAAEPAVEVRALDAVDVPALRVESLAWGRWGDTRRLPESISIPYREVRVGRDVSVGNGSYALWREEDTTLDPGLRGQVELRLAGGGAALHTAEGMREARLLDGGRLGLDFDARRFDTSLSTQVDGLRRFSVEAAGDIQASGVFVSVTPDTHVAGALSADGQEAGYFFERVFPEGLLEGITLWGR